MIITIDTSKKWDGDEYPLMAAKGGNEDTSQQLRDSFMGVASFFIDTINELEEYEYDQENQ